MLTKFFVAALPLLAAAAPSQHVLSPSSLLDGHHGEGDTIDLTKYTIGQILNYTLGGIEDPDRHTPPLKKLAYVVNRTDSIKEYLSDPDISVTLFAPDDKALEFPHHGDGDHEHEHKSDEDAHHEMMMANHPFVKYDEHDHPDDEEKRRFIKKLVTAILHYHISPSKLPISELRDHSTIPTTLNQTRDTDVSFRIRVSPKLEFIPPPPRFEVGLNFYSQVRRGPTLLAKNGIIHLVSAPLLPPLTPLDQLFLFPNVFATLTSAVQQTELDHQIAPYLHEHNDHHESLAALVSEEKDGESFFETVLDDDEEPSAIVMNVLEELVEEARAALPSKDTYKDFPFTIFAPTNSAFAKIPFKIRLFLFSPFGRPILKKLLSYHIVPQFLFHSDYQLNATRSAEAASFASIEALPDWFKAHLPEPGHLAGRHGPPHDGPPHHGPPRDGPPHHGPPHDGPPHHGPPHHGGPPHPMPHGKVNVTKYELPTLLGSGKNESLSVNVYAFRIGFGNGPIIRRIAVGNTEQEEKEYSQVIVGDGVAWGGAVHVIRSLIRPPFVEHHEHDHDGVHEHHGREHKHKHEHKHHDHDHEHHGKPGEGVLAYFKSLWA